MTAPTSANPAGCDVELPVAGIIPFSATDWPGKLTCTIFTQGCMWTCTYCHNPTLQPITPGEHAFTAVVDLLGQRRGLIDALVISGGEPTLHHGLGDAIAATQRSGFPVGLHTCGYAPGRLGGSGHQSTPQRHARCHRVLPARRDWELAIPPIACRRPRSPRP